MTTEMLALARLLRDPVTLDGIAEWLTTALRRPPDQPVSYATAKRCLADLRAAGFRVQDRVSESGDARSQRRPREYWLEERELLRALRALAK